MTEDEYYREFEKLAQENGLQLTDNAQKIAMFRERTQLPMSKCPCSPNDPERGCISKVCMEEIQNYCVCHCQLFKKG